MAHSLAIQQISAQVADFCRKLPFNIYYGATNRHKRVYKCVSNAADKVLHETQPRSEYTASCIVFALLWPLFSTCFPSFRVPQVNHIDYTYTSRGVKKVMAMTVVD